MSANTIAPPHINQHQEGGRHRLEDQMSMERQVNLEHLSPIIDNLTQDNLDQLDTLNDQSETDYSDKLDDAVEAGRRHYMNAGLSEDEAMDRITQESTTREFQNRIKRDAVEDQAQDIEDLLPNFIGHLNPRDPDYAVQVDEVREALYQVAGMPRREWEGDRDEQTDEHARNGVYHDIARHHNPNYDSLFDNTYDSNNTYDSSGRATGRASVPQQNYTGRASVPNNAPVTPAPVSSAPVSPPAPLPPRPPQGPNRPPQNLNQARPLVDRRESVADERYGVKKGDRMAFTQKLPNGGEVRINYVVDGFPPKLADEPNPPVMLIRTEQYYVNGQPAAQERTTRYAFSGEQLNHIGRDVKEFQKSKGTAVELGAYWKSIDKREKRAHLKETAAVVFGAAALAAVGVELQRRGQDLDSVRHGIGHAFDSIRDIFGFSGTHGSTREVIHTISPAPNTAHQPGIEGHTYDILTSKVGRGEGGLKLYHDLGLSQDQWYGQEHTLLNKHPGDFYRMANGHVGLLHPGKPLSPEAAADIARLNGLLK